LAFCPVSHIAEQHEENFFRVSGCHRFSPLGEFGPLGSLTRLRMREQCDTTVKSDRPP
jgi:hypothetical protein